MRKVGGKIKEMENLKWPPEPFFVQHTAKLFLAIHPGMYISLFMLCAALNLPE
jgi:hypothetical protein